MKNLFGMITIFMMVAFSTTVRIEAAEKKAMSELEIKRLAEKQVIEQGLSVLRSKDWTIYFVPSGQSYGKKLPLQQDVLTFKDGKMVAKILSTNNGYGESNFTPSLMDNQILVWETMQTNEAGDLAFWRGELRGEVMVGFLTIHSKKGQISEYSFSTNPPIIKKQEEAKPAKKK